MSTVTVTYSHAAPFIRERLAYRLHASRTAANARDRARHLAAADAYTDALDILMSTPAGADQPAGMKDPDAHGVGSLVLLFAHLGGDAPRLLGAATPDEFRAASR